MIPILQLLPPHFPHTQMMGRVKLKIKRLENTNGRQATYAKRKHGIMKKANELSILCDIDLILLMFSSTGKPSLCNGNHGSIEEVITKFAQLTPQERAKRKLESLEVLKKTFKKLDHDVNVQDFLGTSSQTIEDLSHQAMSLQDQLSEIHKRLSYWSNPDKITDLEHLGHLEDSIRDSLNQIQTHKENLGKQQEQLMSLECNSQYQNLPFRMGVEQQLQHMSWVPNNDNQHLVIPEDPNLLPHRDLECSASSSFGSYSGYFSSSKNSEISNSGQENSILNNLGTTASLRLQLGGQYPYMPYNLNMLCNGNLQPVSEVALQENTIGYHIEGNFEAPRSGFDPSHHNWAPTSGASSITMFEHCLYPSQRN